MSFANRLLGSFWIMAGILIGGLALVYIILFDRISAAATGLLGGATPVINFLAARFGPSYLNWWGLGLAVFLVLLGMRLLTLTPAARPVAMAFHLLAGIFVLAISLALFLALNRPSGPLGALTAEASQPVLIIGLLLGFALLGIGAMLGSSGAWKAFTTASGGPPLFATRLDDVAPPPARAGRLINVTSGQEYPLKTNAGRITIGSAPERAIVLVEKGVSGDHAFIEYFENAFHLADNTSRNGTYLNGERVEIFQVALKPDDVITLGEAQLRYEA